MKKLLFNLLFFLSLFKGYSQAHDLNKLIPNAPSTSQIERVLSPEINEYKGIADIKIPIHTINVDEVRIPIYLTYDSSGIKVEEEASWVGQSWNLITGGMVTRNQIGAPDDMKRNIGFSESYTIIGNSFAACQTASVYDDCGWFYSNDKVQGLASYFEGATALTDDLGSHLSKINKGAGDTAPDIFNVFLPSGRSERFFFENQTKLHFFDKNSIKVTYTIDDIERGINKFTVRDVTGTKYEFNNLEYLRFQRDVNFMNSNSNVNVTKAYTTPVRTPAGLPGMWTVWNYTNATSTAMCSNQMTPAAADIMERLWPKAWYVSKIRTIKGREIKYNYVDEVYYSLSNTYQKNNLYPGGKIAGNDLQKIIQPRLLSITWDEGKIVFEANENVRDDVYNNTDMKILSEAKALKKIKILDNNNILIREYVLNQSYNLADGYSNVMTEHEKRLHKRLFLDNLEINDGHGQNVSNYYFIYNSGSLPNRLSFEQDYWGYYNNNDAESLIPQLWWYPSEARNFIDKGPFSLYPRASYSGEQKMLSDYLQLYMGMPFATADRRPNPLVTQNRLLKRIVYPSGGELNLEYEQNTFKYYTMTVNGPGLRVKKTILKENLYDINPLVTEYKYNVGENTSGKIREIPHFTGLGRYSNKTLEKPYYNISSVPLNQYNVIYNSEFGYSQVEKLYSSGVLGKEVKKFSMPISLGNTLLQDNFGNTLFSTALNNLKSRATFYTSLASEPESSANFHDYYPYPSETNLGIYYGKPTETTTYGQNGSIIKESKSTFSYSPVIATVKALFVAPTEGTAVIKYLSSNYQITADESKDLYENGQQISLKKNFTYDYNGQLNSESFTNSRGDIIKTTYEYPYSNLLTQEENFSQMKLVNAVKYPIIISKYTNDVLSDKIFNKYVSSGNYSDLATPILPVESFQLTTNKPVNDFQEFNWYNSLGANYGTMDARMRSMSKIHKFDSSNGNTLEFSDKSGKHTVLIWGYKKTKVIAKLENITYDLLAVNDINNITSLSNGDTDDCMYSNCKEQLLRLALNNLRTLYPQAIITTYTYNPMVGVTSITDPTGNTNYYQYDDFARLKSVKDINENLKIENSYHYKTQN